VGFLSAFGYWLGSCLGNVFYWVLISTTLGRFFPQVFGEGTSVGAIIVSLIGVWAFHFMILRGVKEATFINKIVTVAKIVPLIVAILIFVFFLNYSQFSDNFFGGVGMPEKTMIAQVRDTMLITVFVFIGIEGASVYSRYAAKRSDVGSATILGFVAVTGLMVAVTLLPYATAPRASIAGVANPSLAGALELVVGHWGAVMISVGVLVSVLGAFLAWSLICAEVLFAAGKSKDMPRLFAAQNANDVPANALWLSNILVSLFIISTYWSRDAFNFMLDMASVTSLLPYLLVAAYGVLIARSGLGYETAPQERGRDQAISWVAVVYTIIMFIAAGLKYVLLVTVLFAPGTVLYFWARREQKARLFTPVELAIFAVVLVGAAVGVYGLATGLITP
jgi:arginine:ornithine antiporter / lysine permease